MQHKIEQKLNHPTTNNTPSLQSDTNIQAVSGAKLPQSHFKAYLKSKVHRPHVSPEFIQHIKTNINKI